MGETKCIECGVEVAHGCVCGECVRKIDGRSFYEKRFEAFLLGLRIMRTYGVVTFAAEHDVFYAGFEDLDLLDTVVTEDRASLEHLGWLISDTDDGWQFDGREAVRVSSFAALH